MSSVKGTPTYWKQFFYDVLAMVKDWEYPHISQYLLLGIFNAKLKYFSKISYLTFRLAKQNIMLNVLNFRKRVAPNIENEAAYIEFIEKTVIAQLSIHLSDPELSELVKTYQVHVHSCRKYNKSKCCISYGQHFPEKTIIANLHVSVVKHG